MSDYFNKRICVYVCISSPAKWVHAVQMPVNAGTLSDIKGNAASGSHLQHAQQCPIHHAVSSTTAAGTSLNYALTQSKNTLNNAGWFHKRIMHLCVMQWSGVNSTIFKTIMDGLVFLLRQEHLRPRPRQQAQGQGRTVPRPRPRPRPRNLALRPRPRPRIIIPAINTNNSQIIFQHNAS